MKRGTLAATVERQIRSHFRSRSSWTGAAAPVLLISALLFQTARATDNPAATMFLAVLSALWIGGSGSIREVVDERPLVAREPHLSLLAYGIAKIIHAALLGAGQSLAITLFLRVSDVVGLPILMLWTILFLTTMSGALLALLLSAVCDVAATALAWFPLLLVPQVVFGGFLFPFATTRPFAIAPGSGAVIETPAPLVRSPVREWPLRAAGALAISRWALEAYASAVFEADLSNADALTEAIRVAGAVPLTLGDVPAADRLLEYLRAQPARPSLPPPAIDAGSERYLLVLTAFGVVQGGLFIVVLAARDPRRS